MRNRSSLALTCCVALLLLPALVGCGGGKKSKIWVYSYPDFYTPELKRIAVLPFADRSGHRGAGDQIGGRVSAILTKNGTYEVYTRQHLKDILAEKDLLDAGIIEGDAAMEIGRLESVQALVGGVCDRYDVRSHTETRYNNVPQFGQDAYGNMIITHWIQVPYQWTRHEADVACRVVVVDTETGRQIGAVADPTSYWAEGSPPELSALDVLRMAEEAQIAHIVRSIAVTRTEIKLKGKVVRTATELYDNEWDWQDAFEADDPKVTVVVTLPAEADRNRFELKIIKKGERKTLAETKFQWTSQHSSYGWPFEIAPLLEQGGPGEYEAKLYSGPEPIAWYTFRMNERKPD